MQQPGYLKLLQKGGAAAAATKPKQQKEAPSASPIKEPTRPQGEARKNKEFCLTLMHKDLDFETVRPQKVQIMLMSEEELTKLAVVDIKNDEKKGKYNGTIADKRMHPHNRSEFCSTCFLPYCFCPGHLGMISLVRPIINIWAYKYVFSVLESICLQCGSMLLNIDTAKRFSKGAERLKKIADLSRGLPCRNEKCPNHTQPNPSFIKKLDNMMKIQFKYPNSKISHISSTKILNLFKSITTEELEALGFPQGGPYNVHPKNMIFTALPVIPQNHRPNAMIDGDERTNALTSTYNKIVQINNILKNGIRDDRFNPESLVAEVTSIYHRDADFSRTGNPNIVDTSKNINEILAHKKGLFRSNAQSKRVDHTGRTIIGPGGFDVPFGRIRLPSRMKKILMEERVCDQNYSHIQKLLDSGAVVSIQTQDKKINAANRHPDFKLKNGMIVKRMLQDGDVAFFNRNPTLYKGSFMGYILQFEDVLTIGMHSSCTTPHNADFDGDEGNIHVCPDYYSRAEILHLSGCWHHIISGHASSPLMGLVYNTITSAYLMSRYGEVDNESWDRYMEHVFQKSSRIQSLESRVKRRRPQDSSNWKTGPALFSALLPEDFYYQHAGLTIHEGVIVKGEIKKAHLGPSVRSIPHMLYFNYGTHTASQFISEGQNLLDMFIERVGFTVGYRDCSMPNEEAQVQKIVADESQEAQEILQNLAVLIGNKNPEIRNFYQESVKAALDKVKVIGSQIVKDALTSENALKVMADAGSKGKDTDIAQVIGIVGQQFVRGDRPVMHFNRENGSNEGLRFLPYYDILHKGQPEKITSRGFVDRPLGKGMRPGQFFAHMMASRIGLIDTAFGTAMTGYSQHVITKAMEDLRYSYNGTICNELGQVIQYAGGYDSYDPLEMIKVKISGYGEIWSPVDIGAIADMLNNED